MQSAATYFWNKIALFADCVVSVAVVLAVVQSNNQHEG